MRIVQQRSKHPSLGRIALVRGIGTFLLCSIAISRSAVMAQELSKESMLPLALANKAVAAAIESCKKDGYRVSVSVVDRAGVLRAMGRA
ncbi:MAG: heme-binding protein, partial [Nitrospira sp.]|nr:heme-binding protein [Nitrospira sp.]